MQKFIITTDSTCDLPLSFLNEIGVKMINLHYFLDGEECDIKNFDHTEFYSKLRRGSECSTSQPSPGEFIDFFTLLLEEGYDILHLCFANVLSGTFANATATSRELLEKYPERRITVVDTKSASAGQGLIVYLTSLKKGEGYDYDQCIEYAESMVQRVNHVFTINDLKTLAKTGRVSASEAWLGTLLQIKPILYSDKNGKLTPWIKTISRKLALNTLCDKIKYLYDGDCKTIFITHSDSVKDANFVASRLTALTGVTDIRLFPMSPVISCHTGADTIAVFFSAKDRSLKR